jgi:hypothetical protein
MRVMTLASPLGLVALGSLALTSVEASAQTLPTPGAEVYVLEDTYLDWPVAADDRKYAAIDGRHLHDYVEHITGISRRYRDQGHQFWGRIQGTSADRESAEWIAERFAAIGLEVRTQPFDLAPQWFPQTWDVTARSGGRSLTLTSAQPGSRTVGTEGATLDLDVVYVGLGHAADFQGRDVRGKAVLIYSIPEPGVWSNTARQIDAVGRAQAAGAAAALVVIRLPGNVKTQFSVAAAAGAPGEPIPGFTLGQEDGNALREMIETAPAGQPVKVSVRLDIDMVEGLQTYNVWGTLPGMTDEKILVVAHRDGYFESAGDNASGMATMLGLAEYFASIPREQRRRTIQLVGSSGHHGAAMGVQWMADNAATVLDKTALAINAEHTALTSQHQFAGRMRPSNTMNALHWSFNGSRRLIDVAIDAFDSFGVPTYTGTDGVALAEISRIRSLVPSFGVIDVDTYYHSDHETAATVPWTGLAATTRAMAKLIDGVNKLEIEELVPQTETAAGPR